MGDAAILSDKVAREAELSVIGALVLSADEVLPKIIDVVEPGDFGFADTRAIYKEALELSGKGREVDYTTLLAALSAKEPENVENIKKDLIKSAQLVPSTSTAEQYAKIVVNCSKARRLKSMAEEVLHENPTAETAGEIAEKAMDDLYEINASKSKKRLTPMSEIGIKLWEDYISPKEKQNIIRCDTGFRKIDGLLKGMFGGNLIILAARPKIGKSAMAATIAENVARSGKAVAFYSMEMQAAEIYERILSRNSNIEMNTLIDQRFRDLNRVDSEDELAQIQKTIDKLEKLPLYINDNSGITVNQIRCECRMMQNLGLIVIDYLQLMRSTRRYDSRNLEIGSITRELKILAGDLNVPILLLSQLNRSSNDFDRPSANELRDSGSIEQDANKVCLMWCTQEIKDEMGRVIGKKVGFDVALNRRGGSGVVILRFDGSRMRFTETNEVYEEKKKAKGGKNDWRKD